MTLANSLRPLSTLGDITDPLAQGYRRALQRAPDQFHQAILRRLPVQRELCLDEGHGRHVLHGPVLHQPDPELGHLGAAASRHPAIRTTWKNRSRHFDIPSDLRFNYNWDLPVGRGKHFFNVQRGWINQIIGNWKTSGNLEERSGYPFSVYSNTAAGFPDDVEHLRPNIVPGVNPILPNWHANCDNLITQICPYLNSLAFFTPPAYLTVGNATRVMDNIRMPHVQRYNMAFLKEFPIHEQIKLAFRAELYGALNHPYFAPIRITSRCIRVR